MAMMRRDDFMAPRPPRPPRLPSDDENMGRRRTAQPEPRLDLGPSPFVGRTAQPEPRFPLQTWEELQNYISEQDAEPQFETRTPSMEQIQNYMAMMRMLEQMNYPMR